MISRIVSTSAEAAAAAEVAFRAASKTASRTPLVRNLRVAQTVVELQAKVPTLTTPARRAAAGEWLAERLDELGATYIKVGQFIASRSDVYGTDFSSAFVDMHDRVAPVTGEAARELVTDAVDVRLFQSIDFEAVSAASIAQIHRGRLLDGRRVVIKVVRPGVRDSVRSDMRFLDSIATAMVAATDSFAADLPESAKVAARQARDTVRDLSGYLNEELDLRAEAKNLARFGRIYPHGHAEVRVPRIVKEACGPDAVVMEYVPSVPVSHLGRQGDPKTAAKTAAAAAAINAVTRSSAARRVMIVFIRQLLSSGIVHGDPHVGNMGVDDKGRLVVYDFGSVVRLSREDICHVKDLVSSLVVGDVKRAVAVLRRMGADVLDENALAAYVGDYREYMRTLDFRAMAASAAARASSVAASSSSSSASAGNSGKNSATMPIVLPGRISRIVRSFALLEGVCKAIDPGFNYFDTIAEAATRIPLEVIFDADYLSYKLRYDIL
jgi:predicted unusual protein kinase regulating ubiquinone biosynthesis (AarF/ABC1/UbiB family)